jgi:hypothetical protein
MPNKSPEKQDPKAVDKKEDKKGGKTDNVK